jgi:hypothetical protein
MSLPGAQIVLAAEVPQPPIGEVTSGVRMMFDGFAPVLAAILAVLGAVIVWAFFFRKRQRRPGERHRILDEKRREAKREGGHSHRRRRRREKRRPINPTVAETGELPPIGAGEPRPPAL